MKYLDGWNKTPTNTYNETSFNTSVSIIVAAYNEEQGIKECVQSILACDYPMQMMELIVVDNNSSDSTLEILKGINDPRLKICEQKDGHKKESIECGIQASKNRFLLFTDGDCVVKKEWIKSMIYSHEIDKADCVLGPLEISRYNNLLTRFQAFDLLAMMGITSGGLKNKVNYLANGANFGYTQKLYHRISSIPRKDYASGDDVMTLHAFVRLGDAKIVFQKDAGAIVRTKTQASWKELIQQRIRWASKSTSYVSKKDIYINGFIFIFCLSILINFLLTPVTGGLSFFIAIFQLFIKGAIDYAFLDNINKFFKKKHLMKYFISSFLVHFVYIIFTGVTSLLGLKYNWKGKKLR